MFKRTATLLLAVLLLAGGFIAGSHTAAQDEIDLDTLKTNYERIFSDVYARVSPSVVSINVLSRNDGNNPLFDEDLLQSGGTGFVFDTSGHLITNAHVVDEADEIAVYFFDGTIARASIIGVDRDSDIAVIQVEDVPTERLFPIAFGDSDNLLVGQATLAIGSPFGEDWTLTSGIISALNRSIRGLSDFSTGDVIQTDAAINPGNSGGPLLNLNGEVIGVNSQILSSTRSNSGIGFAVPSNLVLRVAVELIENGVVNYSYMGISGGDMNLSVMEDFELPNNIQGAVVNSVVPNSPAANAGLENPTQSSIDIIVGMGGEPIHKMDDLLAFLASNTAPGDTVAMRVLRDGETIELEITLGDRPGRE